MKKKALWIVPGAAVVAALLMTTTFADSPIKLVVNGTLQKLSAPPVVVNQHVLVPARGLAEALGAKVGWDSKTSTVEVQSDAAKTKAQIQGLEQALAPQAPEEAADKWAQGAKTRNAALQYAVMSPDLRAKNYDSFAAMNWSLPGSSPWVQQYKVMQPTQVSATEWNYLIEFEQMTSTGISGLYRDQVTVDKIDGHWYVSAFRLLNSYDSLLKQSANLPDGTPVKEGLASYNQFDFVATRIFSAPATGKPGDEVQVPVAFYQNGKILQQEQVTIPAGTATLSLVEEQANASSQQPSHLYYLTIPRSYPNRDDQKLVYTLMGSFTGNQATAKQDLLKIAQTWKLPQ